MKRSEMPTVRVKPVPVVLIVGASPAFLRRCNDVTMKASAVVVESDVSSFSQMAAHTGARAVIVPDALFNANAALFNALAAQAGTRIVTFPGEAVDQAELEARILAVLPVAPTSGPASNPPAAP